MNNLIWVFFEVRFFAVRSVGLFRELAYNVARFTFKGITRVLKHVRIFFCSHYRCEGLVNMNTCT